NPPPLSEHRRLPKESRRAEHDPRPRRPRQERPRPRTDHYAAIDRLRHRWRRLRQHAVGGRASAAGRYGDVRAANEEVGRESDAHRVLRGPLREIRVHLRA
ncbi:Protein DEL-8, partial [Aphelenchoides avenae]